MTTPPVVRAQGLTKTYGTTSALDNVGFAVSPNEIVGLVGKNGAGKSTLIRVLAGAEQPDSGAIEIDGKPVPTNYSPRVAHASGLSFMHQELANVPELSVAENIVLGARYPKHARLLISRRGLHEGARRVLREINARVDTRSRVGDLSSADQRLVMIARALYHEARLLILDEPSAALAEAEVLELHAVVRRLKRRGCATVYVSHRLREILSLTDRVVVMRDGAVVQDAPTRTLDEATIVHAIVGGDELAVGDAAPRATRASGSETTILEVQELATATGVEDVTFSLARGEILGIGGLIGSGRTELVRAIFGADPITAGKVLIDGRDRRVRSPRAAIRAGLALLPEDRRYQGLVQAFSVRENVTLASLRRHRLHGFPLPSRRSERRAVAAARSKLNIRMADMEAPIPHLSGGNQQKVVLAKWLETTVDVLIFDEPTVGVDVSAKQEVFDLIAQEAGRGKAIIVISSDMSELAAICSRVVVLQEGRVSGVLVDDEVNEENIARLSYGHKSREQDATDALAPEV